MRLVAFGALVAGMVGFASAARAEQMVVLPFGGSDGAAQEAAALSSRVEQRLARAGHGVAVAEGRGLELAEALLACDGASCVASGLDALDAEVVVAPALWVRADGARELTLTALGRSARAIELTQTFSPTGGAAAADALVSALLDRLGELLAAPEAPRPVSLTDEPRSGHAPARRRSELNVALGVGLLASSLVPFAFAGRALARDGDCAAPNQLATCPTDEAGRYEVVAFGPRSIAMMSAGGALAAGGTILLAARPIRMRVSADAESARVVVGGRF